MKQVFDALQHHSTTRPDDIAFEDDTGHNQLARHSPAVSKDWPANVDSVDGSSASALLVVSTMSWPIWR